MRQVYSERDREVQRRMMEAKVQRIEMDLDRARVAAVTGRTQEVERVLRNVRGQLNDQMIPIDLQRRVQVDAKKIELESHVKLVDMALEEAREAALARRDNDRARAIKVARESMAKAMQFGAPQSFKDLVNKKIDVVSMTGGHRQDGPTTAKPIATQPKVRDLAKGEKRIYKRFESPHLVVKFGEDTYRTIDWSIGGMLIGDWRVDVASGSEIVMTFGLPDQKAFTATIRVVRFDPRKRTLAVRFVKSTMDALEFVRNLIKQATAMQKAG